MYRLGKYQSSSSRHRPLLIKFLRAADATYLLSNKSKLKSQVFLKPDLTPEDRAKESLLLKERWSLIQKGTERKLIKLHNYSIFVNGQLHCKVVESQLEFQSSSHRWLPLANSSDDSTNPSLSNVNPNKLKIIVINCQSIKKLILAQHWLLLNPMLLLALSLG